MCGESLNQYLTTNSVFKSVTIYVKR